MEVGQGPNWGCSAKAIANFVVALWSHLWGTVKTVKCNKRKG
jgi:hypothetical protein